MANKTNSACLQKAAENEPIFVLRAQDATAPHAVRAWIRANVQRLGQSHPKIVAARKTMSEMRAWGSRKLPD